MLNRLRRVAGKKSRSAPVQLRIETLEDRVVPAAILGWDFDPLTGGSNNFGPSSYNPTTTNTGVESVVGLTRGAGVGTTGTGAGNAWGGIDWIASSQADAITA